MLELPRRQVAIAFLAIATLVAVVANADAQSTSRIRSNLDGKTIVPLRTPWTAYPSAPAAQIKEVEFLIAS